MIDDCCLLAGDCLLLFGVCWSVGCCSLFLVSCLLCDDYCGVKVDCYVVDRGVGLVCVVCCLLFFVVCCLLLDVCVCCLLSIVCCVLVGVGYWFGVCCPLFVVCVVCVVCFELSVARWLLAVARGLSLSDRRFLLGCWRLAVCC